MTKYSIETVSAHIRRMHPGCPEFAVEWFAAEIAGKSWKRVTLGKAVGITMQTHLRHNHTDYDTLLLSGIGRREARRRVQPRITAMILSWSRHNVMVEETTVQSEGRHEGSANNDT